MAVFRRSRTEATGSSLQRVRRRNTEFDNADAETLDNQIHEWVDEQRPKLGEVLLELGSVDPDDLLRALQQQKETPGDAAARAQVGQILIQLGSIDERALAAALAQQFGVPLVTLTDATIEPDAVARVPEELARRHGLLPLRIEDDRVQVVTADPLDVDAIRELTMACGSIAVMIGARSEIDRLIDQTYNVLAAADDVIRAFELADDFAPRAAEEDEAVVDENAPVVQVVSRILIQGVRSRASDIHIEPGEHHIRVRFRIDGAMTEAIQLPSTMSAAVASRLKVMAGLNIVERRRPQDGQLSVNVDGRPIDVRIATAATVHGEKVVLRLLDKTKSLISLKDLGMPVTVEAPYMNIVKAPLGMLLCTGPTGSGKTTTLYATMTEINDPSRNVVTIEDPVEYQFDGISQMQVSDTGLSFAAGLRGVLRQDPDVILVGEIRDEETARIAMQAALTGHFVLSSMHAVDAVAAIYRFTDMGIEPFLVASALTGVVGQRLLRRMCTNCREPYVPSPTEVSVVAEHVRSLPSKWLRGAGCNLCNHTGYRGRIGVYELLEVTDQIRELIVERAPHHTLRDVAIEEGMKTMQEQAFDLVVDGVTTVQDVIRSVYAPGVDQFGSDSPKELPPGKRMLRRGKDALEPGAGDGTGSGAEPSADAAGPSDPAGATESASATEHDGPTGTEPAPEAERATEPAATTLGSGRPSQRSRSSKSTSRSGQRRSGGSGSKPDGAAASRPRRGMTTSSGSTSSSGSSSTGPASSGSTSSGSSSTGPASTGTSTGTE